MLPPAVRPRKCRRTITRLGRSSTGVHGAERNVVYERLDNGAQEGVVKLREVPAKEKTLRRGDVICYLPDDFHHIETPAGSGDALHLAFLWPQPRAPARPPVGRHGDGGGQAFHGPGQDPDAAALGAAGQGNAEVERGRLPSSMCARKASSRSRAIRCSPRRCRSPGSSRARSPCCPIRTRGSC